MDIKEAKAIIEDGTIVEMTSTRVAAQLFVAIHNGDKKEIDRISTLAIYRLLTDDAEMMELDKKRRFAEEKEARHWKLTMLMAKESSDRTETLRAKVQTLTAKLNEALRHE